MRRLAAVAVVVAGLAGPAGARAADTPSPVCTPRRAPIPADPAQMVSDQAVAGSGGRLHDITLDAPALFGRTHLLVLLPKDYDPTGTTRYPVLYLLHGAFDNYGQWVRGGVQSAIDEVSAARDLPPFITVMPDGGSWGFYSDWYGTDVDGQRPGPPPAWTQFHIGELVPWIDARYPTVAERGGRAIAGLSMGGYGAMSYAARYPDLFGAAASFSGVVDPDLDYPYGNAFLTAASLYFDQGHLDQCVWGDLATQQVRWEGNDPTYLATNLASTSLFVASGGGDASNPSGIPPNPADAGNPVDIVSSPSVEETCYLMSRAFTAALDAAGISHTDSFYGSGAHSMKYWIADLRAFLPQMAAAWAHPLPAAPGRPFSYRSTVARFSVWDWEFATHRDATEFTYLSGVDAHGLTATGSGSLDVTTAPLYDPGAAYRISIGSTTHTVAAGEDRRLRFSIDLGTPHTSQQMSFDAGATAGWAQAHVVISAE